MGSFDVACVISDLTIHPGDKTGFMMIENVFASYNNNSMPPEGGTVHYDFEYDGYRPYLPPVFGKYDDYGYLVGIEESESSKFIEKLFRRPIETVIKCVGSDRNIYSPHGEIFECYFTGDKAFSVYGADVTESLVALGFVHSKNDDGQNSYTFNDYELLSKDDKFDKYVIKAADSGRTLYEGNSMSNMEDTLSVFGYITHQFPGFDAEDYWAIQRLHRLSGTFFLKDIYTKMSTSRKVIERFRVNRFERLKEDWLKFREYLLDPANAEELMYISSLELKFDTVGYLRRDTAFRAEEFPLLVDFTDPTEFWRMIEIRNILTSVNKVLLPNHCGEQHGNDRASDYLAKVSRTFLKKRKEESAY